MVTGLEQSYKLPSHWEAGVRSCTWRGLRLSPRAAWSQIALHGTSLPSRQRGKFSTFLPSYCGPFREGCFLPPAWRSCMNQLQHVGRTEIRSLIQVNLHFSACVTTRFSLPAVSAARQRSLPGPAPARHGEEPAAASAGTEAQVLRPTGTSPQTEH